MTDASIKTVTLEVDLTAEAQLEMDALNTFKGPQGEKGDRGEVGPVGPQGERGESGVYTGTETPTDPSIKVWVNPNGDGANILLTKDEETGEFVGIPSIKGDTGDTGPQGPQGEKGDKGEPGDIGELGVLDETEMDTLLDEGDTDGTLSDQVVLGGRILQLWNRIKAAFVRLVNGVAPDADGNVKVTRAYADVVDSYTKETMYVTPRVSSYGRSPSAATIDGATGEEFEIYRQGNSGNNYIQARHKASNGSLYFHKIYSDQNKPIYSDVGAAAAEHTHYYAASTAVGGAANSANSLNAIAIPASANLDSYTTPGFYKCTSNSTAQGLSNCPTGYAFFMMVGQHAGTFQLVVEYLVNGNAKMYYRNCYSSTWTAWKRIYTENNKPTLTELGALAAQPASIEMYPSSSANHGGFIDFHYNGSTADYTSRIIERSSGTLEVPGNFSVGGSFLFGGGISPMRRGTYERIEGTSAAHKNLNDYRTAGFYNGKSVYVDNTPSDATSADFVLLVYPWNALPYGMQEYTETAYGNKRWIRSVDGSGNWRDWVRVYTSDAPPTYSEVGAAAASHTHDRIISGSGQVRTYTADDRIGLVGVNTTRGDSVYLFSTDVGSGLLRYITYESNARASEGTFWTSTNLKLETNGDGTELYITTS